jgi:serine/threonine protein kinase
MNAKDKELCVVTDYAEGGDMFEVIKMHQKRRTYVAEPRVWDYLEQITTGKSFLEKN